MKSEDTALPPCCRADGVPLSCPRIYEAVAVSARESLALTAVYSIRSHWRLGSHFGAPYRSVARSSSDGRHDLLDHPVDSGVKCLRGARDQRSHDTVERDTELAAGIPCCLRGNLRRSHIGFGGTQRDPRTECDGDSRPGMIPDFLGDVHFPLELGDRAGHALAGLLDIGTNFRRRLRHACVSVALPAFPRASCSSGRGVTFRV